MAKKRGRPVQMTAEDIESIIESYTDEIFDNNKLISKSNAVWERMAQDSNGMKKARGFYSYVIDNRNGIKDRLLGSADDTMSTRVRKSMHNDSTAQESTVIDSSIDSEIQIITINFTHREFVDLSEQKEYNRSEKDRPKQRTRQYTCCKPSVWQLVVTEKLWAKKISHGFYFKTHKISYMTNSAYFKGHCNCGSEIVGTFDDITSDNIVVTCNITTGNGLPCGKRYCRGPERKAVGKLLIEQNKAVGIYRAEKADDLMNLNDPEPAHLYTANVLRVAKKEFKDVGRVHSEVMRALEILQLTSLRDLIHGLGVNPFFVHYWSHHQLDVWRQYCKENNGACMCLDATGKIVRPIEKADKSKSKVIFLYECVIYNGTSQFPIAQMITEAHNTNSIQFWLMEWLRSGAPYPREVVCDSSIALLAASVRVFTGYRTIDQYADACSKTAVPCCYIRIDVAHFMKMYANFLKGVRDRIRKFFLASIGHLILSTNEVEAGDRLTWLLTVARSETEGMSGSGETLCEIRKRKLQRLLTGAPNDEIENIIDSYDGQNINDKEALQDMQDDEANDNESEGPNSWKAWGQQIDEAVRDAVNNEIGYRENAHFLPRLADRLVKDIKWLPLWSCISRNVFGYGRVPATSASVESDFNDLKNRLLRNDSLPMRADDFISKHVNLLSGRTKLIDAATTRETAQTKVDIDTVNTDCNNGSHERIPLANSITEKTNHVTVTTIQKFGPGCIACASGNIPGGAHKCIFCKKAVHVLPGCSEPVEGHDEGYGQKRICAECKKDHSGSIAAIVTSNEKENWRGLANKKTKKSRYLNSNYVEHELLLHEKLLKVPILRNGNQLGLNAVELDGRKVTFSNTCSFDSTFQLFLTAALDSEKFLNNCESTMSDFLNLVHKVAKEGLHSSSYKARAKILSKLCPVSKSQCGVNLIECQLTVGGLCCELFKDVPSLVEVVTCAGRCPKRRVHLPRIQIDRKLADNTIDFAKAINESMQLENRSCGNKDCTAENPPTVVVETGSFLIIELADVAMVDNSRQRLNEIPTDLKLSFTNEDYHLVGGVEFIPPSMACRSTDYTSIGHYVAISHRRDHTWVLYDDTKNRAKILSSKYKALFEILLYEKNYG